MTGTTVIKNADWVVGWDATTGSHEYIRNGDVAFSGEGITFVGKNYSADADTTIDGRGLMTLPGTLSLHAHAYVEILGKGFWEDLASKQLWMSQLYEYSCLFQLVDDETARPATQAGICELLRSGCTTFAELYCPPRSPFPGWIDTLAESGVRAYPCPMVQSGEWYTTDGTDVRYRWFEKDAVERNFQASLEIIDEANGHDSGRLRGMVGATQVDTCSPELVKKLFKAAEERDVPFQVHASQSVVEFREMVRRHNMTPLEWLDSLGVLGPNTIIGHGINIDRHPWVDFHTQYTPDQRSESLGHDGNLRRALCAGLRSVGRCDAQPRRLPRSRRKHGARHRQLPARYDRGDAHRGADVQGRQRARRFAQDRGCFQDCDPRRCQGAQPRRSGPARAGR